MKYLTGNLTEYWYHKIYANTDDGYGVEITLKYYPYVSFWLMDVSCEELNFKINGIRVCNCPNLLDCYRNKITFGISCFSQNNNIEPVFINDFSSGKTALYLLNAEETKASANGDYDSSYGG